MKWSTSGRHRPALLVLLIAAQLASGAVAAADGDCTLPREGRTVTSPDGSIRLSYRPEPAGIAVDRQFSLILHICTNTSVEALTVDATMPEHRHGMNYRPSVTAIGAGAYRADGLLLHMPGRWEFVFGVRAGGRTERLTASEHAP